MQQPTILTITKEDMIAEQINQILDKRHGRGKYVNKGRLGVINDRIVFLNDLKKRVQRLQEILSKIEIQFNAKQGAYYQLLSGDPVMKANCVSISPDDIADGIDAQLKYLYQLHSRFSRESVQIAFIGKERQGKSRFLQSISGLTDKVIPAYSGTSCTGTVSVIENTSGPFHADLEFYSLSEFSNIVNEKLDKFFPTSGHHIRSVEDLGSLDLSDFNPGSDINLSTEFDKFKDAFVGHRNSYTDLIGKGNRQLNDPNTVIEYVAQYEEFDSIPNGANVEDFRRKEKDDGRIVFVKNHYKYLAVKSIHIYTQFNYEDCGKIVLVDTVGLGDSKNAESIEQEMFRVLKEDCDAAVDVFKPSAGGDGFNTFQTGILSKISKELGDREPHKWIVYVLNRVLTGNAKNTSLVDEILPTVISSLSSLSPKPVAWARAIDASNEQQVINELLTPILQLVIDNLDAIDNNLVDVANQRGKLLYAAYVDLVNNVASAAISSIKVVQGEAKQFELLYGKIPISDKLQSLDTYKYAVAKDSVCKKVSEELERVVEQIVDFIPDKAVIKEDVLKGNKSLRDIFEKHINILRNRIIEAFENVNTDILYPLQEEVKSELIRILYEDGKLSQLSLRDYSTGDSLLSWLSCFMEEHVDSSRYPKFYAALSAILNYRLNIEGLIEYNVTRALVSIDPMDASFRTMPQSNAFSVDEKTKAIWQEIFNRITPLQKDLRKWEDQFSLIPSHSFYARVHKIREKLVWEQEGQENLKDFYRDNAGRIWFDEFAKLATQDSAFSDWSDMSKSLKECCIKDKFEIVL